MSIHCTTIASLGVGALFVSLSFLLFLEAPGSRRHGQHKERSTGRDFSAQTDVQTQARVSTTAPGWDSERV